VLPAAPMELPTAGSGSAQKFGACSIFLDLGKLFLVSNSQRYQCRALGRPPWQCPTDKSVLLVTEQSGT